VDHGLAVDAIVLLSLLDGPRYGRQLIDSVETRTGGRVRLSEGAVYPALGALEARGLLRSWPIRTRGARGRPRRYYELTQRGLATADEQRRVLASMMPDPRPPRPSTAEVERMSERLRQCSDVSGFLLDLGRRAARTAGTP
jgi:DNA-binding PadR family transcriptional regulator